MYQICWTHIHITLAHVHPAVAAVAMVHVHARMMHCVVVHFGLG